jgi:hypothetical protein
MTNETTNPKKETKKETAERERREAIENLRKRIKPADTVYTVLRHVSRSGMSRGIDLYIIEDGRPVWITGLVGIALDRRQSIEDWRKQKGLKIGGCGMDMGFALVHDLSAVLYGHKAGYKCLGDGKDGRRCPSNYHTNYHPLMMCHEENCDKPRAKSPHANEFRHYHKNPEGAERFDLIHNDGYALKHSWL